MSSTGCKSSVNCIDARVPVRASYVNLYKWPESDVEFVKSMTRGIDGRLDGVGGYGGGRVRRFSAAGPVVVDSFSCRQMYLRSYPFSRKKESVPEKTRRCIDKVKLFYAKDGSSNARDTVVDVDQRKKKKKKNAVKSSTNNNNNNDVNNNMNKKRGSTTRLRAKEVSGSIFQSIFRRLLSCTAKVDVVDEDHYQ